MAAKKVWSTTSYGSNSTPRSNPPSRSFTPRPALHALAGSDGTEEEEPVDFLQDFPADFERDDDEEATSDFTWPGPVFESDNSDAIPDFEPALEDHNLFAISTRASS